MFLRADKARWDEPLNHERDWPTETTTRGVCGKGRAEERENDDSAVSFCERCEGNTGDDNSDAVNAACEPRKPRVHPVWVDMNGADALYGVHCFESGFRQRLRINFLCEKIKCSRLPSWRH